MNAPREEAEDLLSDVVKKCKRFLWKASRHTFMVVVFFLLMWVTGAVVWAQGHVTSRCRHAAIAFTHYDSEAGSGNEEAGNSGSGEEPGKEKGQASESQTDPPASEPGQTKE